MAVALLTAPAHAQTAVAPRGVLPVVDRMPRLPEPLQVRDWRDVARRYYGRVLDPWTSGGGFPVVHVDAGKPGFTIEDYVGSQPATEALTCLSAIVGAKLVGLDPAHLHGVDYVERAQAWYDAGLGLFRNTVTDRSPVVHADIYGYWPAILGMILAAQYPDDARLQREATATSAAFLRIAHGLGAPNHPHYDVLGWDFARSEPGGRPEPMNRFGHAPSVAWALMVGAQRDGDPEMLRCARATMLWYVDQPGRYDVAHVMGPLTAARLNAVGGGPRIDVARVLKAWLGDGDPRTHSMFVTAGTRFGGLTTDGLDAARWPNGEFYAFTMGTLQNPAWLVPVARYEPNLARSIGRFALNAANSARLLEGIGLDADHQDHAPWKARWDPDNLLFYEGLMSSDPNAHRFRPTDPEPVHPLRPYATGDPVLNGWDTGHPEIAPKDYLTQRAEWFGNTSRDLGLYGGNNVGFLGGILSATAVPGILRWDCLATDWFHEPALPTSLIYNPYEGPRTVTVPVSRPCRLYDTVTGRFVTADVAGSGRLQLAADQAAVIVEVPRGARMGRSGARLLADDVVIDYDSRRTDPQ